MPERSSPPQNNEHLANPAHTQKESGSVQGAENTAEDIDVSFHTFYKKQYVILLRFAILRLPSEQDAQDVMNETMLAIFKNWETIQQFFPTTDGEKRVRDFAYAILKRRISDFYRAFYKRPADNIDDIDPTSLIHDELGYAEAELISTVESFSKVLTKRQTQVLGMVALGLSFEQIAGIFKSSEVSIRMVLSRARQSIRANIETLDGL